MKNRKPVTIATIVMMTVVLLLPISSIFAAGGPMTPEFAAKRENFRKQHEQRVTPEKRKIAVDALKAERLKVYKAKQAVQQSTPATIEIK